MSERAEQLRLAMRRLSAAVCVVSVGDIGARGNITISSLIPVSMEPPSVLVSINRSAEIFPLLDKAENFGVSILAEDQVDIAGHCATHLVGEERFSCGEWARYRDIYWLEGACARLYCKVAKRTDFATHELLIGEIIQVEVNADAGAGLVYEDGRYGRFFTSEG